jgi:hypothetical protein
MKNSKLHLFLFNAIGGAAVLGSYVHGILTHPHPGKTLWGGLPESLRPLYTGSMLAAAGGFIGMITYLAQLPQKEARIFGGRLPLSAIYVPLGVIHVASTLWMPLTFAFADSRSEALWTAVRIDLALVGLSAIALIPAVATATPRGKGFAAALASTGAFAFHTAILDAIVWPALYRKG